MAKITLEDDTKTVIMKMAEGNPGAITALCEMPKHGDIIDPESFSGSFAPILSLDTLGIYGSSIYIIWNDQCNRNIRETLMLLRAYQLGFTSGEKIQEIAADQMGKVKLSKEEMAELDKKVCNRLDRFKRHKTAEKNLSN